MIAVRLGVIKMSFDKAIQYGKEHRKPYKGAKAIDKTCRNHGGVIGVRLIGCMPI